MVQERTKYRCLTAGSGNKLRDEGLWLHVRAFDGPLPGPLNFNLFELLICFLFYLSIRMERFCLFGVYVGQYECVLCSQGMGP